MMADQDLVTLTIEKGEGVGKVLRLRNDTITICRGKEDKNAMAFNAPFISRRHAEIWCVDGCFFIRDLKSKNGTRVNGVLLEADSGCRLGDNDLVDLANGEVLIRFKQLGGTQAITVENANEPENNGVWVDNQAREAWVNGEKLEPILTRTEFDLLSYLYKERNKACSKDEIAANVWKEEFITDQQIEQYVYRLRKRIEVDLNDPQIITTMRGYGYKLVVD
ncbi:winged helix-turn-helix domain-containing protein [Chloroflexota bacterium]